MTRCTLHIKSNAPLPELENDGLPAGAPPVNVPNLNCDPKRCKLISAFSLGLTSDSTGYQSRALSAWREQIEHVYLLHICIFNLRHGGEGVRSRKLAQRVHRIMLLCCLLHTADQPHKGLPRLHFRNNNERYWIELMNRLR
jgi:hypothetical protein